MFLSTPDTNSNERLDCVDLSKIYDVMSKMQRDLEPHHTNRIHHQRCCLKNINKKFPVLFMSNICKTSILAPNKFAGYCSHSVCVDTTTQI